MAWGHGSGSKGVEDWVPRLRDDDPKLTSITVFRTRRFSHQDVVDLCSALECNTSLLELHASSHQLSPEDAEAIASMLRSNRGLQHLAIGDSSFGDDAMTVLAAGLAGNRTLQKLDVSHKGLTAASMHVLACGVVERGGLDTLILSQNEIGDAGAEALAPAMPLMREVEAHDCGIGSPGIEAWAAVVGGDASSSRPEPQTANGQAALHTVEVSEAAAGLAVHPLAAAALPSSSRLRSLHLDGNKLGAAGARALRPLLARLEEVHLGSASLGDEGACELAAALSPSAAVRILDVNENGIGERGAAALAEALQAGSRLRVLRLRGNAIGDAGAAALGRALATEPVLEELDVGHNDLALGAAELLRPPSRLRRLSLFAGALGDEGACAVAEQLAAGSFISLMELELSCASIGTRGMVRLFSVLEAQAAPALEMLVIGGNPALEEDVFEGRVEALWAARPDLDVAWRSGDAASFQQLGGAPALNLNVDE